MATLSSTPHPAPERDTAMRSPRALPALGRCFTVGLLACAGAAVLVAAPAAHAATLNLTQYVNPFIGTDDSNSPNPVGGGAGGRPDPRAAGPLRLVAVSPRTPAR